VIHTAKVEPGRELVVFGLGGIGLNVVQAPNSWRGQDHRRRHQPETQGVGGKSSA